jgi:hypothetical protein
MPATTEQISSLLHEAGDTHHRVFRMVDGADDDWASWYAWWLINLSELPDLLGFTPVRSELIYLLVSLDKHYTAEQPRSRGRPTTLARSWPTSVMPPFDPIVGWPNARLPKPGVVRSSTEPSCSACRGPTCFR